MEESDHISLGLRLSLLESLTHGDAPIPSQNNKTLPLFNSTVFSRSLNAQRQFLESIDKYKPILQFINDYKDNQAFLYPTSTTNLISGTHNGTDQTSSSTNKGVDGIEKKEEEERPSVSLLSTQSIISLLLESESDLRQLDREMRMCEHHYERGTAGAGKLAEYEELAPRLAALQKQASDKVEVETEMEKRVMQLLDTYSIQIDAMSKLFIKWDQILTETEDALTRLERSQN